MPEENSTQSGWSNGTGSNSSGPGSASRSSHSTASGSASRSGVGTWTTAVTVGRPARISATSARRSMSLLAVAVAGDRQQHLGFDLRRSGRSRCGRRTRARTRPRSRRGSRWPGTPPASRGCSAGRRRPGRRGRPQPLQARRARATCSRSSPKVSSKGARVCERASTATSRDVVVGAEHVLGVVEARAREPLGARHLARAEHALVGRVRAHAEEVPQRAPEALEVGHRPREQLVVAGEVAAARVAQPLEIAPELGGLAHVGGRRPHHRSGRRPRLVAGHSLWHIGKFF